MIVVASGPSLPSDLNPISDPSVYVINLATGAIVSPGLNDNWKDTPSPSGPIPNPDLNDISNSGRAPANDLDSAIILRNLEPGAYSAICFGTDGSTNQLEPCRLKCTNLTMVNPLVQNLKAFPTRGYCGPLSSPRIVGLWCKEKLEQPWIFMLLQRVHLWLVQYPTLFRIRLLCD